MPVAKKRTGPRKATRPEPAKNVNHKNKDSNENNVEEEASPTSEELTTGTSGNIHNQTNGEGTGTEKQSENGNKKGNNKDNGEVTSDDEIVALPPAPSKDPVVYEITDDEEDEQETKDMPVNPNDRGKPDPLNNEEIDGDTTISKTGQSDETPMIRIRLDGVFEQRNGEEEEDSNPHDIQSMMEVQMSEGDPVKNTEPFIPEKEPRRPRRAAAQAAANTIKNLVTSLESEKDYDKNDRNYEEDSTESNFPIPRASSLSAAVHTPQTEQYKCHVCSKFTICSIVVRRYGTELHMCSNSCFNTYRNPKTVLKVPVPCAQCGSKQNNHFYWETMNYCSDACVANYALTVGGKCATCESHVAWSGIGKYCVRFGSDIRQFCTASCLESYKKNARVCFNCQLDIKQLKSVVIANIPPKSTAKPLPKEFCTQDCVEMYVETNMNRSVKSRKNPVLCVVCGTTKTPFRDIILATGKVKMCSEQCWKKFLYSRTIVKTTKCETCTTFIPYEAYEFDFVANENANILFCAPTCKNVYVLGKREIQSCTSCKVKKYNFDLIRNPIRGFSVCSLSCIPGQSNELFELQRKWECQEFRPISPPMPSIQINSVSSLAPPPISPTPTVTITSVHSQPIRPMTPQFPNSNNFIRPPKRVYNKAPGEAPPVAAKIGKQMDEETNTEETDIKPLAEVTAEAIEDLSYFTVIKAMGGFDDEEQFLSSENLIVVRPPSPIEVKNKSCSVRPRKKDVGCSADIPDSGIRYVPVPFPVYIPVPFYPMSQPVPVLMPFPIPIPTPLLFDFNSIKVVNENKNEENNVLIEEAKEEIPNEEPQPGKLLKKNEQPNEISEKSEERSPNPPESQLISQDSQDGKSKTERWGFGLRAWKLYFGAEDPLKHSIPTLVEKMVTWVKKGKKPSGTKYRIDLLYYFLLGLQEYFEMHGRTESFFYDPIFHPMIIAFTESVESTFSQGAKRIQLGELNLWESGQCGSKSPYVLLFTLIYFFLNRFQLTEWQDQSKLNFDQVIIESDDSSKYIRIQGGPDKSKDIKLREKKDTPLVCPVKMFEIYLDKCQTKEGAFLKSPMENLEKFWFSEAPLEEMTLYRMHVRASLIKSD